MPYKNPEVKKAKHAEYSKAYYEKNKAKVIRNKTIRKKELAVQFAEFKATKSCIKCGESHPATLDFHHVAPINTDQKVYELVKDGHCWPRIMREVEKCIVLCANCHRIYHHDERQEKKQLALANI